MNDDYDPILDDVGPWRPYYDRQGRPISLRQWAEELRTPRNKVVAQERVGWLWVSTVWLGIDHRFLSNGPPLIFETMVFLDPDDPQTTMIRKLDGFEFEFTPSVEQFGQSRYSTEAEALAGHDQICAEVRDWIAGQAAALEQMDHERMRQDLEEM